MSQHTNPASPSAAWRVGPALADAAPRRLTKIVNPDWLSHVDAQSWPCALILLAAGKGSRFGAAPKCVQTVGGLPLARHSVEAFRRIVGPTAPVIGMVHHLAQEVMQRLGTDLVYVQSENPVGGTAFATMEAFSVPALLEQDPVLILCMGDRIIPSTVFRRLLDRFRPEEDGPEADLTLLSLIHPPPRQVGKGRVVRDAAGHVRRIIEQRDIDALSADDPAGPGLHAIPEVNGSLFAIRARRLFQHLGRITNANAQQQFYLTDIVASIVDEGGCVRSLTLTVNDPEYDILGRDVTQPHDLAALAGALASNPAFIPALEAELQAAVHEIRRDRPASQVVAITAQLQAMLELAQNDCWRFEPDRPVAVGIAGGRLRIAFMHPDMGRFFGPAWQMPIGAANAAGREQIVVMAQEADDDALHLYPFEPIHREKTTALPSNHACMFPGDDITDWYQYEGFGTRMSEHLLMSLGYFSDAEVQARREAGVPLPPPSLWVSNGMRRPFSLIGNAIASIRTLRDGPLGARIQTYLGRNGFRGLRLASSGSIPRGGFSSSSAVTVAVKNSVNALYDLGISPDQLIHLACQAEYGTGVRAGSLDQATVQKGKPGQGALISSNPREHYPVLGVFPVPSDRFRILFPFSVDRDRDAWRWSLGRYAETPAEPEPTCAEIRKLTGKAAEIAAVLLELPVPEDFFSPMQGVLLRDGVLCPKGRQWACQCLQKLPLRIDRTSLETLLHARREGLAQQLREHHSLDEVAARQQAGDTLDALLHGWRDPRLARSDAGQPCVEDGVPLRAMVAYLFGEVAKNFELIHHPERWIACVTRSQAGDRCVDVDLNALPDAPDLMRALPWEADHHGPDRMAVWLRRAGALPVNYNRGISDADLRHPERMAFHRLAGGNFFRGLPLIDLADALLKRYFGENSVAVRVNAAGQGDYFQVHVDTQQVRVSDVKDFLKIAFYRRFGLNPEPEFIEPSPGGGAVGIKLSRYDRLPSLIHALTNGLPA